MNDLNTETSGDFDPLSHWMALVNTFPERCALLDETVYALPLSLIDALERIAPKVLSKEDLAFERSLTESAGMGFFLRKPFWSPLLRDPGTHHSEHKIKFNERFKQSSEAINSLMNSELESQGCSKLAIREYNAKTQAFEIECQTRRKAYAGWLISDPNFEKDRQEFWKNWSDVIKEKGELPSFPKMEMAASTDSFKKYRDQREDYLLFFKKWGLETFSTPQLPLPLHSNPYSYCWYSETDLDEAGLLVFAPWYLFGDKNLKLEDLVRHQTIASHVNHLKPWLDRNSAETKKWGHERFARMLEIYVYLRLGLYARYPNTVNRNKSKIDQAFTIFLYGKMPKSEYATRSESICKTRQNLEKRLEKCEVHQE